MSEFVIQGDTLTNIANAIREKKGTQEKYTPEQMSTEIINIDNTEMEDLLISRPSTFTEYSNDRVTETGSYIFYNNTTIQSVSLNSVTYMKSACFWYCSELINVNLPSLTSTESNIFRDCKKIEKIDLPKLSKLNGNGHFLGCTQLKTIIFRADSVCLLGNVNSFQGTPIESGTGYIYVPDNLVEDYKVATNWVTYAAQIKPISELPEV